MKGKALKDFWVRMESGSSTVTGSFIYLKPNFPNGKKEPEIVFDCGTFLTDEYKVLIKILYVIRQKFHMFLLPMSI